MLSQWGTCHTLRILLCQNVDQNQHVLSQNNFAFVELVFHFCIMIYISKEPIGCHSSFPKALYFKVLPRICIVLPEAFVWIVIMTAYSGQQRFNQDCGSFVEGWFCLVLKINYHPYLHKNVHMHAIYMVKLYRYSMIKIWTYIRM